MAAVSPHHVLRVDNFDNNHDNNLDNNLGHVLRVDHFDNNLVQLVHLAAGGHLHLTRVVVHVAVAAAHRPVPLRPRAGGRARLLRVYYLFTKSKSNNNKQARPSPPLCNGTGGNCHHYLILPSAQPPVIRARGESQITT